MAQNLVSITLNLPSSDPNATETDQFTMRATGTLQGGGGINAYSLVAQVSTTGPTSGFVTITTTTGLATDSTNPLTGLTDENPHDWTIDCDTADTYWVRAAGDPNNGTNYTVTSSAQQVTVLPPPEASGDVTVGSPTATGSVAQTLSVSGSVTLSGPTSSGSVDNAHPKTWSVNQNITPTTLPALYGSFSRGAQTKTASGAVTLGSPTATGQVTQTLTASGSVTLGSPTATGSVAQTLSVTGAVTLGEATASGTAGRLLSVTGAVTLEPATATGATAQILTASGAVTLGEATASGTTAQTLKPSGSTTLESPAATGSVAQILTVSGSVTLEPATSSAQAVQILKPSGSVTLETATASGTVTKVSALKTASGAVTVGQATATGTTAQTLKPSGAVTLESPTATGATAQILTASGSVTLESPTATGVATKEGIKAASGSVTVGSPTATGTTAQTLSLSGSVSLEPPTSSGVTSQILTASGSVTLQGPTSAGQTSIEGLKSATGAVTLEVATASGVSTKIAGATTERKMGPHGLLASYPIVLREFGVSPSVVGGVAGAKAGPVVPSTPSEKIQLRPHGLAAYGTEFDVKGVTDVNVDITGAQIDGEFSHPDLADADIYPDGGDADAEAGSVEDSTSQVSGAQSQAQAGSVAVVIDISATLSGAEVAALAGESNAVSGTGVGILGSTVVAQAGTASTNFDYSATISGAEIVSAYSEVGWDNDTEVGVLVYGQSDCAFGRQLVKYPEQLDLWSTSTGITVTANTADAPDGTLSADTVTDTRNDYVAYIRSGFDIGGLRDDARNYEPNELITAQIYVRKDDIPRTTRYPALRILWQGYFGLPTVIIWFDTQTGQTQSFSYSNAIVTDSGAIGYNDDYWKVWLTAYAPGGDPEVRLYPASGKGESLFGDNLEAVGSCTVWGFTLKYGEKTDYPCRDFAISGDAGSVEFETISREPQQGSWGGGGGKGKRRKKFKKRKFHMPLAGVKLRDRPFENPVIEEEIEQIVDEVIEAAEELESKGYAEAISADIIANMARLKAVSDDALVRSLRNSEAISKRIAVHKLEARINELVRRRRAYIRTEHARILRDQRERARQKELERKRQKEYEIRKARAEWRAELLLNQPIEPYEPPVVDDDTDMETIVKLLEEML